MDRLTAVLDPDVDQLQSLFKSHVYNLSNHTVYYPIRHHSPACSYHLLRLIEEYKPDIILIEGPESGNPLISVLSDEATLPPVSLYYTYESELQREACYYPMLRYSPEYVALKEAKRLDIPAKFIDLDYQHFSTRASKSGQTEQKEISIQDETLLAGSDFINRLCQKTNCRSFDELWEKVFEIGGLEKSTEAFVQDVFTYCTLSRMCYATERLQSSGDLIREAHMKQRINQAVQEHDRVLVITGGFHTYGLLMSEEHETELEKPEMDKQHADQRSDGQGKPGTSQQSAVHQQMYPMVYTFAEVDRLNGYASGMPYVNYYDQIWNQLLRKKSTPYNLTALDLLSRLMRKLRDGHEHVSTSDAIEAYSMIQGLAGLRGKREGGVYELMDAALSSFVKGELTLATDKPLQELQQLLTGDVIGSVAPNSFSIPIVEDFKVRCTGHKLQIRTTGQHKKVLDLYAKPEHRQISQLIQCITYLVPEFAKRQSGPDWIAERDMNLVRETWVYMYSSRIEARLIENSLYGGTLAGAATRKMEEQMQDIPDHHSGELARLMLQALLMGLQDTAMKLYEQVRSALRTDGNFLSLCNSLHVLNRIHQHRRLLGLSDEQQLPELVSEAYRNAVDKLLQLSRANPDEHEAIIQGLKLLAMLAESSEAHFQDETFRIHLNELLSDHQLPAQLEGVCVAISSGLGDRTRDEIVDRARGYIHGTPDQTRQTALFLQGVFTVARDAFLYEDQLLSELNYLIEQLSYDDFISMVPELRLAFTYFTPMETGLIAERVASLHQVEPEEMLRAAVDEQMLIQSKTWDEALRKEFTAWKLI
ncbi:MULTISPECIES: DUF5682 family protein [unclassified Paenibacillus]|uniref:DUF5682 family protein n=1 Tax=unclassified Paenibacillus TaxID=185978 RepID=UPI000CFBF733|nr:MULTISPECIES: DUF5682 family protein [unclassified Paenibacillus]PRA07905.1 hypothetical protein CQ043_11225 [Paenibacillus sp. MYb63]PRA48018.1 hypothetical protein CQ061_15605 [Paenibacillus sp. MYb67]QZN74576.1 DUF5682 family protein [Paenibacillus sp. DR312]